MEPQPAFRFAPSPNGFLHLGHARSALLNATLARRLGGAFLLRIEDIDRERSLPVYVNAVEEDLGWLGMRWEQPVLRQSTRFHAYRAALDKLLGEGLLYPCFCSRTMIAEAVARIAAEAGKPHPRDPDGAPHYPGTCRHLVAKEAQARAATEPYALRLDMRRAIKRFPNLQWREWDPERDKVTKIAAEPEKWGDTVIMRKDTPASYHLAVVVDDAFQGITHIVRGEDLREATHLHRLLQALLGLPEPIYHHHALVLDGDGRKLSKSIASTAIRHLRQAGTRPEEIWRRVLAES
jgi:glutamyl-Q tRNA(Asp) synthetase